MRFKTHLAFAVFLLVILEVTDMAVIMLFLFYSFFPDIDLHTSTLGRKVKPLSWLFEIVLGHRGILHSLWSVIILYFIFPNYRIALVGYLSHLVLDSLNKKGVAWFWPFLRIRGPFVSGKLADRLLFYGFIMASCFLFFIS